MSGLYPFPAGAEAIRMVCFLLTDPGAVQLRLHSSDQFSS